MSSSRAHRKGKSKASSLYPGPWSDWVWDDQSGSQFYRYREIAPHEYEYDWESSSSAPGATDPVSSIDSSFAALSVQQSEHEGYNSGFTTEANTNSYISASRNDYDAAPFPSYSASAGIPCPWPGCGGVFNTTEDSDRHYKTMHANNGYRPFSCTVQSCQAGVKSWTKYSGLRSHNNKWHGPYNCSVVGCNRDRPNGFSTSSELQSHVESEHNTMSTNNAPVTIRTGNLMKNYERFDPHYKVHHSRAFKWGRVFKCLFWEPKGNDNGKSSNRETSIQISKHGQQMFAEVRRFLIVNAMDGHCICLALRTYGGQGTRKHGVHASDHAVVYTTADAPATPGEYDMIRRPLRVKADSSRHWLDPMTRLNYAKLYTIEYNVKVWFIGEIHANSVHELVTAYNTVHPPMPSYGSPGTTEYEAIDEQVAEEPSYYAGQADAD